MRCCTGGTMFSKTSVDGRVATPRPDEARNIPPVSTRRHSCSLAQAHRDSDLLAEPDGVVEVTSRLATAPYSCAIREHRSFRASAQSRRYGRARGGFGLEVRQVLASARVRSDVARSAPVLAVG